MTFQSELESERPRSSVSRSFHTQNDTMTSNFSMGTVDVEALREQLSAASIELEEQQSNFKKTMAKQHRELESNYTEIEEQKNEERKFRVKIKQLENDLEHQLKRLNIICKSKGMARPKRPAVLGDSPVGGSRVGGGGSYVSPYRVNRTG